MTDLSKYDSFFSDFDELIVNLKSELEKFTQTAPENGFEKTAQMIKNHAYFWLSRHEKDFEPLKKDISQCTENEWLVLNARKFIDYFLKTDVIESTIISVEEVLRNHIDYAYYFNFRNQKAKAIKNFFKHYESKLTDAESFSLWLDFQDVKKSKIFSEVADFFYKRVIANLPAEKKAPFNQVFEIIYAATPLMVHSKNMNFWQFKNEVANQHNFEFKNHSPIQKRPNAYYLGEGYKQTYAALKKVHEFLPTDKKYFKAKAYKTLSLVVWLPLVLTIAFYFMSLSKESGIFSLPLVYFYISVQFVTIVCYLIFKIHKSTRLGQFLFNQYKKIIADEVEKTCQEAAKIEEARPFLNAVNFAETESDKNEPSEKEPSGAVNN
ncbi:hypothetical protein [Treponema zioleckii]|uniref:hypothetical protein n=1 Tax=Treponema zioleckii TaxID=331680 RepID=UPI00168B4E84|nr:hypothetical protein [Treponema zioleckii]